jgi:ABC-2 type transport system ATP-binding protein
MRAMTEPALRIQGLAKSFDKKVIDDLDLEIAAGELYALLGPNGAGKTTTLRMAVGLTRPDGGAVRIFGVDALADPLAAKRLTAWLPDEPMLYDKLSPAEYLGFVAGLWRIPPAEAAPEAERLADRIGIIAHGKLLAEGTLRELRAQAGSDDLTLEDAFIRLTRAPQ